MSDLELYVTLWPSFPHFKRFAQDYRITGIRLNSAMVKVSQIEEELKIAKSIKDPVPLYFDVKGKQLRVTKAHTYPDRLELDINHPIKVKTPTVVLFKAAADYAVLEKVVDETHLVFQGGPEYMVYEGESLHIRDSSLEVNGPIFCEEEIGKIKKAVELGFDRFFMSYVESQECIDELRKYVGEDAEIIAKIENKKGLEYVANEFKKQPNLSLMAARGDLYVEIDKPHDIMDALKLIISKDPEAYSGSRKLLSIIHNPVPECADLLELAWLYDIGYRKMMLCDEICLKEELLARAINVFESFRQTYTNKKVGGKKNGIHRAKKRQMVRSRKR